ncbi:negative regulation of meiotic nuclear division [Branchiostoma belcheri]|nr:negative regulation of meiotic nuclear division [Branchiostoma belcheri]
MANNMAAPRGGMPTDSIEEGDCLVPQSPYTNKHIPNHFQLKEGLIEIEDQLLGKEHSESCLHDVGVSSENRKEPSLKENTQDRAKEESVSRQGDNCMCHVGSQKAVNVARMPKSANGPQNSNITSSNGQGHTGSLVSPQGKTASIKGSHQQSIGMLPGQVTHCERYMYPGGQDNKTRVHVAVPDNVEGVKVAESVNIPPVEWEEGSTFADSALGLSVSSFDTDSYMEGSHGLSCIRDTMMTEETDIIVREASSNTSISGGKDGDVQEEQLLTDFKENTKLSGRHVHFKLSPEKHPAPPPSPSDTVPCKTRKQQSPRKIRASPSKLRKSPKKNSPHKCSSPPKLRFSPVKLRSSPGKRCSPSKLQTSTGRSKASPGKRRHPAEVNKVRKSLLGDFGSVKTPGTIKRKLFSRDLPRRPAQSRCDVAEPAVMETGGMDDSGLALSLSQFVLHERQPGSKVGCDYVDFIGEYRRVTLSTLQSLSTNLVLLSIVL